MHCSVCPSYAHFSFSLCNSFPAGFFNKFCLTVFYLRPPFFRSLFLFSKKKQQKNFSILLHWICKYNPIMDATNQKYCTIQPNTYKKKKSKEKVSQSCTSFHLILSCETISIFPIFNFYPPEFEQWYSTVIKSVNLCACVRMKHVFCNCLSLNLNLNSSKSDKRENTREDTFPHK